MLERSSSAVSAFTAYYFCKPWVLTWNTLAPTFAGKTWDITVSSLKLFMGIRRITQGTRAKNSYA